MLGHVDATAEIVLIEALGGDNWWLGILMPRELTRYVVSRRGTTTPWGHPQDPPGRTVVEPAGQVRAAAGEKGRLEFGSQLDAGCPHDPGDAAQLGVG